MTGKLSAIVFSITPFDERGQLDEAAFRRHLGRLRDAGVSVYVGGGAIGEGNSFTSEERDRVLGIAVEELKGKVPVRAGGSEPRVTGEMVAFVRAAERAGVDVAQILSLDLGHGAKPTMPEMEAYYATVIEATSLPVAISVHPAVGYFVPIDLLEKLANRYPQIVGIHYGGAETPFMAELVERFGSRLELHAAGAPHGVTMLALGGNGFMGAEGNTVPELVASVIAAWQAQDMERLREVFGKLNRFSAVFGPHGGPSSVRAVKPLLNALGLPGGSLRPPRKPIAPAQVDELVKSVVALEIPGTPASVAR